MRNLYIAYRGGINRGLPPYSVMLPYTYVFHDVCVAESNRKVELEAHFATGKRQKKVFGFVLTQRPAVLHVLLTPCARSIPPGPIVGRPLPLAGAIPRLT